MNYESNRNALENCWQVLRYIYKDISKNDMFDLPKPFKVSVAPNPSDSRHVLFHLMCIASISTRELPIKEHLHYDVIHCWWHASHKIVTPMSNLKMKCQLIERLMYSAILNDLHAEKECAPYSHDS